MKKLLAFISALTVCVSCFSCAGKKKDSDKESSSVSGEEMSSAEGLSAVKLSGVAYKKKAASLPSDMSMLYSAMPFNGGENYLLLGFGKKSPQFWVSDRDFTTFKDVEYPDFDIGTNYNINLLDDGTAVTFVNSVDYGGVPAPDPFSEEFDESEANYTLKIYTYAPDGSLISGNDVTDFSTEPYKDIMIGSLASDGKKVLVNIAGTFELFDIGGAYIGSLTVDEGESVDAIGNDRDGNIIIAVRTGDETVQFRKLAEDGTTQPAELTYNFPESIHYDIVPGSGDYSMYVSSLSTIYGIRADDNTIDSLFSLNAAGLNSSNFSDFAIASDGNFIIPVISNSDWTVTAKHYTPCDPSELENLPVLTLGTFHQDSTLPEIVEAFNDESNDCRIEIKYYQENIQMPQGVDFNDEEVMLEIDKKVREAHQKALDELRDDALKGELPDIVLTDPLSGIFGNINLAETGALTDLYEFIDKDDTLNRESIVPSLLRAADEAFDGHIYSMPTEFNLSLDNVMKTKFAKDITEWDFNTYMDYIENESEILGSDEEFRKTWSAREMIMFYTHWIDMDKAECHFDSPEFLRYLEYCNAGEPVPDEELDYTSYEYSDEEHDRMFIEQQNTYREDRRLLGEIYISEYTSYLYSTKGDFGGEELTYLGEVDGEMDTPVFGFIRGGFAITKDCQNKELAWEFIKYRLSDSFYKKNIDKNMFLGGFPATKSGLQLVREKSFEPQDNSTVKGYEDYTGYLYNTAYRDENGDYKYVDIGYVTDELIAEVDSYIDKAVISKNNNVLQGIGEEQTITIDTIYNEEFDRMINGEITPEECAYMLQNRLSIYLSENFG